MEEKIYGQGSSLREILCSMEAGEERKFAIPTRRSVRTNMYDLQLDGKGEWSSTLRKDDGFLLVVRRK